jgi:hypothetical protein
MKNHQMSMKTKSHHLQEDEVHGLLEDVQVHRPQEDEHVMHGIDLNLDAFELQQQNEGNMY